MRMASLLIIVPMLVFLPGMYCAVPETGLLLPPNASSAVSKEDAVLVARLVHITDTHAVDAASPARFTEAFFVTSSAWRPFEAYSTHLLDGIIRATNRIHADGQTLDFLIHTGDASDNAQRNEFDWFLTVMDGGFVNPLSGPDDRPDEEKPAQLLDPFAAFEAQGLYQKGRHGELDSIPWFFTYGNHDCYALGVLPFFEVAAGRRLAPVPLPQRPGLLLPTALDPLGSWAAGRVTPGDPGPPRVFERPLPVEPSEARAYLLKGEISVRLGETLTGPAGHGAGGINDSKRLYSELIKPGLRLIGLDTTDREYALPTLFYIEGAISRRQMDELRSELELAAQNDELVIVAGHHPSVSIAPATGSETDAEELRALLSQYPNVILHLAGHKHRNRVVDQGGYLEIETCSTLDLPQEARLIEVWREAPDDQIVIVYGMFSHLDGERLPLGVDPLRALREQAFSLARGDKDAGARQRHYDPSGADPRGRADDRSGSARLR